jgi:hypothetical protein
MSWLPFVRFVMAVYLTVLEKAEIFKEACSENCLIHLQ